MNSFAVKFLLLLATSMLVSQRAEANTVSFPATPLKALTLEGTWNAIESHSVDPGKGNVYNSNNFPDQVGAIVLDANIPESSKKVLNGKVGTLTPEQLRELGKSENPWIVRYCAERGKPALAKIGKKTFLLVDFFQDEHIRVATANGAQCIPAGKYESHAFVLHGEKLFHIYLIRNIRDERNERILADQAEKFRTILTSAVWQ